MDTALAAGLFVLTLVVIDPDKVSAKSPTSSGVVLVATFTCAALVWRRAAPRPILAASAVGNSLVMLPAERGTGPAAAALLAPTLEPV